MSGPAHRVQSAVVEYGYPRGHLGHLSEEEEAALENFKLLCAEKGYYKPAGAEKVKASHDDATLLRFLRARRFIVADAYTQFQETEDWRQATQLDQLYETIDLEQYEETRQLYPQWTGRRDKRGIPLYLFEVKHLNAKTMSAYEKSATSTSSKAKTDSKVPPKLMRLFALYENLTRFVMPLCTALTDRENPRTPITQNNNIVDITGVSLKMFWNLRGHMQDASTLATAHYPETLDRIFIVGAPSFFPIVWGWIKKWFDPITTSKIFILSQSDMKQTLESFIDPANIPKKYGGELDFTFGDFPNLDPALQEVVEWKGGRDNFPHGPLYWVDETPGVKWEEGKGGERINAIAVGSIGEKEREEEICTVTRRLEPVAEVSEHSFEEEGLRATRPELLTVSTATNSINQSAEALSVPAPSTVGEISSKSASEKTEIAQETPGAKAEPNGKEEIALQAGKLVPASRPEPVSFVTASEGVQTLSLNEKSENIPNGTIEPHEIIASGKLDSELSRAR